MCDETTLLDNEAYLKARGEDLKGGVSRRAFGSLSAAAFLAAAGCATTVEEAGLVEEDVSVTTPDGVADCYYVHPASGKHPAVIVWPDIMGLRPAFRAMGRRLAESGYSVLVVNPFYRSAKAPVVAEGESFADTPVRNRVLPMARALNAETHFTDAKAFVAYLDAQANVDTSRGIGTTGYCMGGPMVMRSAAAVPSRIKAGASFHGGGLATKADSSPHLLIPQMTASFLIAVAENDDESDPEAKETLRKAFAAAGRPAEIEVYEGAMHGWCPPDSRVYHEAQAERAWSRLLALFETALA